MAARAYRFLAAVCLMAGGLYASAVAQAGDGQGNEPLTAAVMQDELFGIQMSGVVVRTGEPWTECIEPSGRTLYEIGGYRMEGVLEILPEAIACFTYDTGTSCFRAQRAPRGYLFRDTEYGSLFRATKIQRGVKTCISSELIG